MPKAIADPGRRANVLPIDCAEGGQAAQDIDHPDAAYWDTVYQRLRAQRSAPLQAQVVWLKEAERTPTGPFPASAETLRRDLATIVRIIKQKLPNVRACYVSSRIYAGYATTNLNPEPYAYESGFAVKWLIDEQAQGVDSLNWDPARGPVHAPWITWGPYLWADGLNPRGDGLTWRCDEYQSDGTHPSSTGQGVVADTLLGFFHRDDTTPWYRNGTVGIAESEAPIDFAVGPNPARRRVDVRFAPRALVAWSAAVLDLSGRRVRDLGHGLGGGPVDLAWDLVDTRGARVPSGVYWVRVTTGSRRTARRVLVLAP
ncbi:MAG: T9SS type A sorting domain-containing protein [Candidatus Eisenbacteria bacterium]|uniref:T9SS type A sorting domain-containing protein n=1 Tax=Eiseniibacteriota bacterium TaxID=2212470 RepID=A0A538U077_UNCEI|nr:MAG: T9SS type A sorting domain-containing protein [Candidatus Eisenbacteria bacterium]